MSSKSFKQSTDAADTRQENSQHAASDLRASAGNASSDSASMLGDISSISRVLCSTSGINDHESGSERDLPDRTSTGPEAKNKLQIIDHNSDDPI